LRRARGLGARRGCRRVREDGRRRGAGADRPSRRAAAGAFRDPFGGEGRTTDADAFTGGEMIGIIGGGLSAAKVVESYREAGGTDEIVLWSQDPHGPYHR